MENRLEMDDIKRANEFAAAQAKKHFPMSFHEQERKTVTFIGRISYLQGMNDDKITAHIASLEAQLEKAEKVIGFYVNENGDSDSDREEFYIEYQGKEMLITKLGKKAREYFAEKEKKSRESATDLRAWNEQGLQNKIDRLASQVNSLTVTNRELRNRLKSKDEQFDRLHQMYQQEKQKVEKAEAAHG